MRRPLSARDVNKKLAGSFRSRLSLLVQKSSISTKPFNLTRSNMHRLLMTLQAQSNVR
jgi:hypothetical protein